MTGDTRPQFELDLDNFVKEKRIGVAARVHDCISCGFFGYVIFEEGVDTLLVFCPGCGRSKRNKELDL